MTDTFRLFLAGDVMTGRGIDQVMPQPLSPTLYEPWVRDAREYVRLAECATGAFAHPVTPDYPWGEALAVLRTPAPDLRIVNLETAITAAGEPWPGKGIHYRMNPAHIGCLAAADIDACTLANNHVLDWGAAGLGDTLAALRAAGIAHAGAGADAQQARAPAALALPGGGRLLLFAWGAASSGVPGDWEATTTRPGVARLPDIGEAGLQVVSEGVQRHRRDGDRVVVSLHWGANWVEEVPRAHRHFAHALIDRGLADVVHGHSSHHPLPIEVHAGKLVLYGCGDLINDYEGITQRGTLRSDMGCLYVATLRRADGGLQALEIAPLQLRHFRLAPPEEAPRQWLRRLLDEGGRALGTRIEDAALGRWRLAWR